MSSSFIVFAFVEVCGVRSFTLWLCTWNVLLFISVVGGGEDLVHKVHVPSQERERSCIRAYFLVLYFRTVPTVWYFCLHFIVYILILIALSTLLCLGLMFDRV